MPYPRMTPVFQARVPFQLCFLLVSVVFCSCADKAQRVVDKAIDAHGGDSFTSFHLEFDFRDRHYTASRNNGMFTYTREFSDSTGKIRDVLNNEGLTRYRNESVLETSEERKEAFRRSVNSVIYFALLPYGLNDEAVRKTWVDDAIINNEPYQLIRVTFEQEGGGEDHQDVFLYWFHAEKNTMDYFAYSYKTDGGGTRFREAVNPRSVGGILLQDYINYRPQDESISLDSLMPLFLSGKLRKLSEIRLENITVSEHP